MVAVPVVALLVFGGLVASAGGAAATPVGTSVTGTGLCFGKAAPGGCASGTTAALAGSTVRVGVIFTATSGAATGQVITIDANRDAPDTVFPADANNYLVHVVGSFSSCAAHTVVQNNSAQALMTMPDCGAGPGDQVAITIENVVVTATVGSMPMQLSTDADTAVVDTNPVNIVGAPTPPTSPGASGGDHSVTVAWSPPLNDGGPAISGYKVFCAIGTPSTAGAPSATTNGSTFSATVSNLTRGTTYSCVVTASNGFADSDPSDVVQATPTSVPNPPSVQTTIDGDALFVIFWSRPSVRGGTPITHYRVYCSATEAATVDPSKLCATTGGRKRLAVARGLTNGVTYSVVVAAENALGISQASSEVFATPNEPPSRPWAVRTKARPGSLVVRWKVPTSSGTAPITGYITFCSTDPHLDHAMQFFSETNHVRASGLTSGTQYYCGVQAVNDGGAGMQSHIATGTPR